MKTVVLFASLLLIGFASCKKENDSLNIGNNEAGLSSLSLDTFSIQSSSKEVESIVSNGGSTVFLGSYNSSELGSITNDVYSTLAPSDLTFRIPDEGLNVADVTLQFTIVSAYGSTGNQQFQVRRLTEQVAADKDYFTSDSLMSEPTVVGAFELTSDALLDTSIALDKSIGEFIINQGNVAFTTAEVFADLFKGINIHTVNTATANSGMVYGINSTEISLTVNCTGKTSGTSYSLTFKTIASSRSGFYCKKDRIGSKIAATISNPSQGDSIFYLQGLSAASAQISFPHVKSWSKTDNILINKATLILNVAGSVNASFSPPTSITCHVLGSSSSTGIQATYDANSNSYTLEIESLLSDAILADDDLTFDISVLNSDAHPEQLALFGKNGGSQSAELKIFYTKY